MSSEIKPIQRPKQEAYVDPVLRERALAWQKQQLDRVLAKQLKAHFDQQEAERKGISVAALKQQRRDKWLLRNGRATIASIIATHGAKAQSK